MRRLFILLLLNGCFLIAFAGGKPAKKADELLLEAKTAFYTDVDKTLALSQEALVLAITNKNTYQQAQAYILLGKVYNFYGFYAQALEYKTKALDLAKSSTDPHFLADCLNSVGVSFRALKRPNEAIDHYLQAYHLNDSLQDTVGICKNLTNIASLYKEEKNYTDAKINLTKSLWLSRRAKYGFGITINLLNLGKIYELTHYYSKAEHLYQEALTLSDSLQNKQSLLYSHRRLAEYYLPMNQLSLGKEHLRQAISLASSIHAEAEQLKLTKLQANYAEANKNWQKASYYYAELAKLSEAGKFQDDSLRFNYFNRLHKADESLRKYELLQARLNLQENELVLARTREEQQRLILFFGTGLVILLLLFSLVISRLYYSKQRTNQHLKELAEEVASQKDALAKANQAITEQNNYLEEEVKERTSQLQLQNTQLRHYAFFNAHKVRGPLARILGLLNLLELDISNESKAEVFDRLRTSGNEMDQVLREINEVLNH